jgi:SagB-type dehydrogenase family enzyme
LSRRFRVHAGVVLFASHVDGGRWLVAETRSSEPKYLLRDPRLAWALAALHGSFTKEEAVAAWREQLDVPGDCELIWEALTAIGLVQSDTAEEHPLREWSRYGWTDAALYQYATLDYPFVRMDQPGAFDVDERRMQGYLEEAPPPGNYQEFTPLLRVPLTKLNDTDSVNQFVRSMTVDQRRGLDGLSILFDLCFGERSQVAFTVQGSFLRKAVPSGGARHPTEIFLIAFPGLPLPGGIYHYSVRHNALDLLRAGDFQDAARQATFDLFKKYLEPPVGLVVFTSLVERAMWRYRDSRSWRAIPIDCGHSLMGFRTVCQRLGFGSYSYQKFQDREICRLLGVDIARQPPLYVATLV